MVSWIILSISLVLFVIGVTTGVSTFSWLKNAKTAEGKVVQLVEKRSSSKKSRKTTYAPKVSYEIEGEKREFVSSQSSSPSDFKIGQTVRVAINPEKTKKALPPLANSTVFQSVQPFLG